MSEEKWIFVVDTEQYAGNFERDMCAFMTGMTGDCGVGGEEAQLFLEQTDTTEDENPFENFVTLKPDEHGCARPTAMWDTPGWFSTGMGGQFKDGQEEEAKAHYIKECLDYGAKHDKTNQKRWKKTSEEPFNKSHASLSVAIFFEKKPTEELVDIMIKRAKGYAEYARNAEKEWDRKDIKVVAFRLLKEETVQTLDARWIAEYT